LGGFKRCHTKLGRDFHHDSRKQPEAGFSVLVDPGLWLHAASIKLS
jgi:hypothetical protein